MFKKIGLSLLLIVLVSFVFFVYDQFNGNPLSKYRAAKALENYLEEVYPDKVLRANEGHYDFKFNEYNFSVTEVGSGTIEAEEAGEETSEKIPEVRDNYFTVAGFFQPEVRMDGIRTSKIDHEMTERLSKEASEEIQELLNTSSSLDNAHAVDAWVEVLKDQFEPETEWGKGLPIDRPITIYIVLDSSNDDAEDFFQDALAVQRLVDDAGYDYERISINGNVISYEGLEDVEDKDEHRGYVKFAIGFDKGEELARKNMKEF